MFKRKKKVFYHAAYDKEGHITAFYHDEVSPVPKGVDTIKLTDDEWEQCHHEPHKWSVKSGKIKQVKK